MAPLSLCFSSGLPLAKRYVVIHGGTRKAPFKCVAAPEQTETGKKIRVVSAETPISARPPSPPRHYSVPAVGYFLEHVLNLGPMACDKLEKYGPIFVSNYFLNEMVHVSDYNTIVEISRAADIFKVNGAFEGLEAMFPDNMNGLDGAEHTASRAAQSPAFAKALLPLYYPLIQHLTSRLWAEVLEASSGDEQVILQPYLRRHYMRSIVEISTGIAMDEELTERIQTVYTAVEQGVVTFKFGPLGKPAFEAQAELLEIIRGLVINNITEYADVIDKVRECGDDFAKEGMRELKKGNLCLLSVLIASSSLSTALDAIHDPKVVDYLAKAILFLWAAGISTNSGPSLNAVFELGFNPEAKERLVSEQDATVAANNGEQDVTCEQVMKGMPLLDSFISETMRMRPAESQLYRIADKDVEILGKFVPKGTMICLNNYSAHLDEKVYKNAKQFVVDRFTIQEDKEKPPPILSFGAPGSVHYCIGYALAKLQIKNLLATLLRSYNIKLDESQTRKLQYLPVIEPKSGVIVESFTKRE